VLDIQTGETLPFANIMLLNRNIGTTADIGGAFALMLSAQNQKDTLVISYMGYQNAKICVSDLQPDGVFLKSKTFELETFQFTPGKRKTVVLNPFRKRDCFVPYDNSLTGNETYLFPYRPHEPVIQSRFFPSTGKNAFIREVWVHTHSWSLPATFRLRLLHADENQTPADDLITENLMIEVTQKYELVKINLEKHHLRIPDSGVFIGVELLIIPENKHLVALPDGSDTVVLYSPYLSFFSTGDVNAVHWIFTGGSWKENQLQLHGLNKNKGYIPAISVVIEE
jgi:hypothetical protein